MSLKDKLLSTNLFFDNEYLNQYISLIESNLDTPKQKYKTQRHHIIPNIAFKIYSWTGADDSDNLVNLLYRDHILAHYYLALSSKENQFKYKMISAINFILGRAVQTKLNVDELKKFTLELDKYQELYEGWSQENSKQVHNTMLGHTVSSSSRDKISKSNSNRVYVNKDGVVRSLHPEELQLFLDNGWVIGNPNCLNRNLGKGRIVVHKDNIEKYIDKSLLDDYIKDGWVRGRSDAHIGATRAGTITYYSTLTEEQKKEKCGHPCSYKGKKRPDGERIYDIVRKKLTGRTQSEYQKIKNSLDKRGTIHMTNGEKDIMIKKELEKEYLDKGFRRGRSKNRKKIEV